MSPALSLYHSHQDESTSGEREEGGGEERKIERDRER
jgi:hypothetical protein